MKKSNVEVKVLALNTLYEYAKKFIQYEKEFYSKFIGINIFKVDGSIKAKYEHERLSFRGKLPDGAFVDVHYWFNSSYSFDIHIKLCINGGSYDDKPVTAFCQYEELTSTLFELKDNVLTAKDNDISYLDKRYNVEELTAKAKQVKELAEKYETLYNTFPYQFKDVFYLNRLTRS